MHIFFKLLKFLIQNKFKSKKKKMTSFASKRASSANTPRSVGSQKYLHNLIANGQIIKGKSKINYFPFQRKVIQYEDRQYIQYKPIVKKVIDYEERKIIEYVPREVTVMDYCAVQKITQYKKQIIPEKTIQMKPVGKSLKKVEYVPVEKQVVYYPSNSDSESARKQSRVVFKEKGLNIAENAEFKPFNPGYIYQMASKESNKNSKIGYYQENYLRKFSNTQSTGRLSPYDYIPTSSRNNLGSQMKK